MPCRSLATASTRKLCLFLTIFLLLVGISACSDHSVDVETFLPEPTWLDSIPAPTLNSVEDVSGLWRSKKRCCIAKSTLKKNQREMYKACYVAIATHSHDQALVAKCLQLMDSGMDLDTRYQINKHYIDNFFYTRSPIDKCHNCLPADPIADVSDEMAWILHKRGETDKAIVAVRRILEERQSEISTYKQMRLYTTLASLYAFSGDFGSHQLEELKQAKDRLLPDSTKPGAFSFNFKKLEIAIADLIES